MRFKTQTRTGGVRLRWLVGRLTALACLAWALPASFAVGAAGGTAWGSINNFDAVNDTGGICHGFEIEIEGAHSRDITYTYDWNHYGPPKITEDSSDPLKPRVFVRYQAKRNPDGSWSAYTAVPTTVIQPTDGHRFTDPSVNFGGEHFGVGFYGAPTAIRYSWLKDDGLGNLVFAGPVNLGTPTFTYWPPAPQDPPQVALVVQAVIVPPPPAEVEEPHLKEFGPATWVKEIKTTTHNNNKVELRDLVSDDPEDPDDRNWRNGEPDEVEVEWRLMQEEFNPDPADENGNKNGELAGFDELGDEDEIVTRRYEFFKYVGPIDAESGEAIGDEVGETDAEGKIHGPDKEVTYNDRFEGGEWVEVTVNLADIVVVGEYIGAQMAGFDPGAQIGLIDNLQDGEINIPYVDRTIVVGGTPPITTTRTGTLPAGMIFDEVEGLLSGTPTEAGTFEFEVHSTDSAGGNVTKTYQLKIAEAPVTVNASSSPAAGGSAFGSGVYAVGEMVTVQATANEGYRFERWSEGGALASFLAIFEFEAVSDRDLVANFVKTYSITTSASPVAGGTTSGSGTYDSGENVTVSAEANAGYEFRKWTVAGVQVSASASYTFPASANRALVANFAKRGDIDGNGSLTTADLNLVMAARNTPASGPNDPRDLDRDGKITVLDARILVLLIKQAAP